jgi:ABC-type phosphate transport system permease subunit
LFELFLEAVLMGALRFVWLPLSILFTLCSEATWLFQQSAVQSVPQETCNVTRQAETYSTMEYILASVV